MSYVAAMLASFLPARHWSRWPLPIPQAAPIAGLATAIAAGLLGVAGFIAYTDEVMRYSGDLQIAIAERQLRGELPHDAATSTGPMAVAMLAPLSYLFLTPAGQITGYLVFASLLRTVVWVADEPMGDPVLTLADHVVARVRTRVKRSRQRRTRERLEGAEVPDRLYPGAWAGLTDADFVIVSSRRKAEWRRGATIISGDECFALGDPFDLQTAGGLRTVYPLRRHRMTEVVRHGIPYDLPPLRPR
jgi:hypothetical protein